MPADHALRGRLLRALPTVLALTAVMTALAPATSAMAAPRRADLTVTATASPAEVSTAGGIVTITVAVRNDGRVEANDATATITFPPGGGLATDTIYTTEWQCDVSTTPSFTCTHASIDVDQTAEPLTFPVQLAAGAEGALTAVGVRVSTTSRETSRSNNTAQAIVRYVRPLPPDLAVGMTIVPAEVIAGGTVYFQIDVHNVGAGGAPYAVVDLPVPANVDPVSPSTGSEGWDCSFGQDVVTGVRYWGCSHGPLAAGEAASTLVLFGRVTAGSPGDAVQFTATARPAELEENTANNSATAAVGVVAAGTIRGLVWSDWDANGQRSADELGVSSGYYGVQQLVFVPQAPAPGDPASIEAEVDQNGRYAVALKPGQYVVQVWVNVDYYTFTTPDVGDDATDSDIVSVQTDPYRAIGSCAIIEVAGGGDVTVDAGLLHLT